MFQCLPPPPPIHFPLDSDLLIASISTNLLLQVFSPREKLDYAAILNLVFCQVVRDVFNSGCIRINKDQRVKMRSLLGEN